MAPRERHPAGLSDVGRAQGHFIWASQTGWGHIFQATAGHWPADFFERRHAKATAACRSRCDQPPKPASVETGYYATGLSQQQHPDPELLKIIRDHWAAIENGSHYRRDHTFGADACQTSNRRGAQILAALRNLALGLYELQKQPRYAATRSSLGQAAPVGNAAP